MPEIIFAASSARSNPRKNLCIGDDGAEVTESTSPAQWGSSVSAIRFRIVRRQPVSPDLIPVMSNDPKGGLPPR